jgi:hypothetical protein
MPLSPNRRFLPIAAVMSLIAFALHVAFCTQSPLINSAFRYSIRNWIDAFAYALPSILLSLLAVPAFRVLPRGVAHWRRA